MKKPKAKTIRRRVGICIIVVFCVVAGFHLSLLFSAKGLTTEQRVEVNRAIILLEERGFANEVFYLKYVAAFRSEDNWLNASVPKENAFAATNFPFEIMTLYPDFFTYPVDDTERAAILLHEAKHLKGADEKEAYEFVWLNRVKLGWTKEKYHDSFVWENIRRQTKEYVPLMFNCENSELGDCTEP